MRKKRPLRQKTAAAGAFTPFFRAFLLTVEQLSVEFVATKSRAHSTAGCVKNRAIPSCLCYNKIVQRPNEILSGGNHDVRKKVDGAQKSVGVYPAAAGRVAQCERAGDLEMGKRPSGTGPANIAKNKYFVSDQNRRSAVRRSARGGGGYRARGCSRRGCRARRACGNFRRCRRGCRIYGCSRRGCRACRVCGRSRRGCRARRAGSDSSSPPPRRKNLRHSRRKS